MAPVCLLLLVSLAASVFSLEEPDGDTYRLVWEDNFDFLDTSKWEHEVTAWGGGNNEFQVYIPDSKNSYTENGVLHLKPTLLKDNINPRTGRPFGEQFLWTGVMNLWDIYGKCTKDTNWGCFRDKGNIPPIASARLRTRGRFSFTYGRIEVRAKMPGGDWTWPAIWLLPERYVYGGWPVSGEIDIVELIGNRDLKYTGTSTSCGNDRFGSTLHWGIDAGQNKFFKTTGHTYNTTNTYAQHFHTYVLDWSENGFRYIVDGRQYLDIPNPLINNNPWWRGFYEYGKPWNGNHNPWRNGGRMTPFDQDFHLLLNVAVGGTKGFIPDNVVNHGGRFPKPWRNNMSWREAKDGFYGRKYDWLWTWQPPTASMEVDYIRVYQR